jgi:hypothetical protein
VHAPARRLKITATIDAIVGRVDHRPIGFRPFTAFPLPRGRWATALRTSSNRFDGVCWWLDPLVAGADHPPDFLACGALFHTHNPPALGDIDDYDKESRSVHPPTRGQRPRLEQRAVDPSPSGPRGPQRSTDLALPPRSGDCGLGRCGGGVEHQRMDPLSILKRSTSRVATTRNS